MLRTKRTTESLHPPFELEEGGIASALWEAHLARNTFASTAHRYVRLPVERNNSRFLGASQDLVFRVMGFFEAVMSNENLDAEAKATTIADFTIDDAESSTTLIKSFQKPAHSTDSDKSPASTELRNQLITIFTNLILHAPEKEIVEELTDSYDTTLDYHIRNIERIAEDSPRGITTRVGLVVGRHTLDIVKVGIGMEVCRLVKNAVRNRSPK